MFFLIGFVPLHSAAFFAFLSALAAIWGMMRWLQHASYTPFVVYRVLLGIGLLIYAYG